MDVDPLADPDAVVQKNLKGKGKAKAQVVQKDDCMIESDSDIVIVESIDKGKGKAKAKANAEGVEDEEWGTEFVVPMLPAGKSAVLPVKMFPSEA